MKKINRRGFVELFASGAAVAPVLAARRTLAAEPVKSDGGSVTLGVAKEFACDVLVVGGGCAGLAAAVSAARHGAKVILAERGGYLGGTATAALVAPFMTSFDRRGGKQIIKGFFDEFIRRLEAEGGGTHPSKLDWGTSFAGYRTTGHFNCATFNDETYKRVAEEMCGEAGVKLLYHALFIQSEVSGGAVTGALFATRAGLYRVRAKVFVDATGDADLARASGVPSVFGRGDGSVQASSMFFMITGVDRAALDAHIAKYPNDMRKRLYMDEVEAERAAGNYPIWRAKILFFEQFGGEWVVNMAQVDDVHAPDPEEITAAEITSRQQVQYIIKFLRKHVAGCRNVRLVKSAAELGVRESYRIVSEYGGSVADADQSLKYADAILCSNNSLDDHKKGYVDYIARASKEPFYIPYRALLPKTVSNMLVAGRCAGIDRALMNAVRVMPPVFAMGQAAGTAAAQAVAEGKGPKEIDVARLIAELKKDGAYVG